ncbi:hypothetical protein [Streptomyces mobaraensis]|uniref:Uncharacterized protein n=1 Tax=Streptomyces mobaraensis TaxID=35621 RepID=A0A5N5WEL7_STRMB|nr:hypothetical protein [Streptomyces mobaraensis]KAB7851223.1 hypothetical protein FRZ00_03645 [Streptomyces mobaraensis]
MATDDDARDRDRPSSGPRHAAPRRPLLARLHMPAGKAVALAAMPTAVLMGMGFTPQLATAKPGAPSPFGDAFCVTAPDGTPTPDVPTPGSPTAGSPTATPSPGTSAGGGADEDAGKEKDKGKKKDKGEDGGKDKDKATSAPDHDGTDGPDANRKRKPAPTPTADPTPDPAVPGEGKLPVPPVPDLPTTPPTPSPDPTVTKSPSPKATPSPGATPAPPAASTTPKPGKTPDGAGKKTEEAAGKKPAHPTADPSAGASTGPKDGSPDATPTPTTTPGSSPSSTPSPGTSAAKTPPPCPLTKRQADKGQAAFADNPWYLEANRLTLTGLTYEGVKEVVTAGGQKKSVLKFSADRMAIDDLHALVNDRKRIYHQSGPGKVSTVDGDRVTMYTEQLKGKLLGSTLPIFAADYTAEHPPPLIPGLKLPIPIFFTDVKIRQAGQFGGTLTIPNMHVYVTDGVYP